MSLVASSGGGNAPEGASAPDRDVHGRPEAAGRHALARLVHELHTLRGGGEVPEGTGGTRPAVGREAAQVPPPFEREAGEVDPPEPALAQFGFDQVGDGRGHAQARGGGRPRRRLAWEDLDAVLGNVP